MELRDRGLPDRSTCDHDFGSVGGHFGVARQSEARYKDASFKPEFGIVSGFGRAASGPLAQ